MLQPVFVQDELHAVDALNFSEVAQILALERRGILGVLTPRRFGVFHQPGRQRTNIAVSTQRRIRFQTESQGIKLLGNDANVIISKHDPPCRNCLERFVS